MITRDVTKLKVGQVTYTTWCDEFGKVIDDGTYPGPQQDEAIVTVYVVDELGFALVVAAVELVSPVVGDHK